MFINLENLTALIPTNAPKVRKKKTATELAWTDMDLQPGLLDLIRLRVLQIHDCKGRMDEQTKKLKAHGETDHRLQLLKDWRRQEIFSDREIAALNLAEAVTRHPIRTVPDEAVHAACLFFNESEMICLTLTILAVNDWHYLDGFAHTPKTRRPPHE